jgi:outer membrane protein assembly factor BamB
VYANGKLFVGTRDGLVALDPATGGIIINYRSGPVSTTPAVVRGFDPQPDPPGKVVFGSSDGVLHAVSTAGGELWHVGLGAVPSSPLVIQAIGDLSVRIVVGAGNTLFAFDGEGNRLWASVLEGGDISKAAAALVSPPEPDRVIVAAGSTLYALDAATGQIVWATTPSGARLGAPAAGNPGVPHVPHILIGDDGGRLYSVDPSTGAVLSTSIGRAAVVASPAIANPTLSIDACIYWGDRGGIFSAADQTDDFPPPEWQVALGGPVDGPPVLANGVIYVGTDPEEGDPHIFALDQANGRVLFSDRLPGGIASSPIVADGRLVVATESGDVLAYDGPDS